MGEIINNTYNYPLVFSNVRSGRSNDLKITDSPRVAVILYSSKIAFLAGGLDFISVTINK